MFFFPFNFQKLQAKNRQKKTLDMKRTYNTETKPPPYYICKSTKPNSAATKVLNQRSYDRIDKKMHFMIRIKGQKQESLKGQNQDYKKNITDDVYQRWYDRINKKIHFITPIKDQKQQSLKGQSQHYKNNVTDDVYG